VFATEVAETDRSFEGKKLNDGANDSISSILLSAYSGWTKDSLWFAVPLSWAKPPGVDPKPYRDALISALQDPNPEIRCLACSVSSATFDLALVPHLGALLDDDAPGLPVGYGSAQSASPKTRYTGPVGVRLPVRAYASQAIGRILGVGFRSKAIYDRWASAQTNPKDKVWYWIAVWRHAWSEDIAQHLANRQGRADLMRGSRYARLSSDFESLPEATAFRILHVGAGSPTLYDELGRDVGGYGNTYPPTAWIDFTGFHSSLSPVDEATYLRRHGLAKRVAAILDAPDLGKRLRSRDVADLVKEAVSVGRYFFGPEDDARLAKLEYTAGGPSHEDVALLRAALSPAKSEQILESHLANDLNAYRVAHQLAERFGSAGSPALLAFYRNMDVGGERREIADCLLAAARRHIPVKASFILDLARSAPPKKFPEADDAVATLAEVANVSLGRDVVDPGYIAVVHHYRATKETREAAQNRARMRLVALEKVKAMLIAGLTAQD
jgi:hypothetical protein